MTLAQLSIGQSATIVGYAPSNPKLLQRILEMGLIRGTKLKIIRFAPMGDPMTIEVRCYKLSVRIEEAKLIEVELNK